LRLFWRHQCENAVSDYGAGAQQATGEADGIGSPGSPGVALYSGSPAVLEEFPDLLNDSRDGSEKPSQRSQKLGRVSGRLGLLGLGSSPWGVRHGSPPHEKSPPELGRASRRNPLKKITRGDNGRATIGSSRNRGVLPVCLSWKTLRCLKYLHKTPDKIAIHLQNTPRVVGLWHRYL
jgi:hypothetical protein